MRAFIFGHSRFPATFSQSAEAAVAEPIQNQKVTSSVLNRTVGRFGDKRVERENFGPQSVRRSAEVYARSPRLLAISALQNPAENVGRGRIGGGRGTGIQRSPAELRALSRDFAFTGAIGGTRARGFQTCVFNPRCRKYTARKWRTWERPATRATALMSAPA